MRRSGASLPVWENEKILYELHPHPLAFYQLVVVWVFLAVGSALILFAWPLLQSLFPMLQADPFSIVKLVFGADGHATGALAWLYKQLGSISFMQLVCWWYFLIPFGAIISFFLISISWLWMFLVIGVVSAAGALLVGNPGLAPWGGIVAGVLGIAGVFVFRRAHTYIITNYRLVTRVDFFRYEEREVLLSRLSDMAMEQSLIGRLLNFGTLIPVSQSGLGLGEDSAFIAGGVGGAQGGVGAGFGRSTKVPRARSWHVLYGITDPHTIHARIEQLLHENSEVERLRQIESQLASSQSTQKAE